MSWLRKLQFKVNILGFLPLFLFVRRDLIQSSSCIPRECTCATPRIWKWWRQMLYPRKMTWESIISKSRDIFPLTVQKPTKVFSAEKFDFLATPMTKSWVYQKPDNEKTIYHAWANHNHGYNRHHFKTTHGVFHPKYLLLWLQWQRNSFYNEKHTLIHRLSLIFSV